jgi:glycosyltransferase involved in cell wall biosynthesis
VDDGSTDDTLERLEGVDIEYPLRVFETRLTGQFGMCKAINTGIAHVRAPITMLLNDDIYLHPDCIKHHVVAHKRIKARHVLIGPRFKCPPYIFGEKVTSKIIRRREFTKHTRVIKRGVFETGASGFPLYREKMMVSSNVSLSTRRLRRLGGYNEVFDSYTGDIDREFYKRIVKAHMEVLFLWRAQAFSVRYGQELYAQTKWVMDNSIRNGANIIAWKYDQVSKSKKSRLMEVALEHPPKEIKKSSESPIIDRR